MHTKPMRDNEGVFSEWEPAPTVACRKCKKHSVQVSQWESNDGGYEDYKFQCTDCKYIWWVEGIDS